jgi:hypothetical protein
VGQRAAVTLPSDARIPIHFGVSYNNFVSKRAGLVMHPAAGAVAYLILASVSHGNSARASSKAPPYVILPVIMCVMLVTQAGGIKVARGNVPARAIAGGFEPRPRRWIFLTSRPASDEDHAPGLATRHRLKLWASPYRDQGVRPLGVEGRASGTQDCRRQNCADRTAEGEQWRRGEST